MPAHNSNTDLSECFACEKHYNIADALSDGVPAEYIETYCSVECQRSCEAMLAEAASGPLADALNSRDTATAESALADLTKKYGIRLPGVQK